MLRFSGCDHLMLLTHLAATDPNDLVLELKGCRFKRSWAGAPLSKASMLVLMEAMSGCKEQSVPTNENLNKAALVNLEKNKKHLTQNRDC